MAKNIKYNREDVVHKATNLYWKKGFHGTSMRNLQDEIDMRPGSIYATFGSKEGLYKESLLHYVHQGLDSLAQCSKDTSSPLAALKMFVKNSVIKSAQSGPSGMCMLVKTVSELTEENAELLNEARRLLHVMEGAFSQVLKQAKDCGELNPEADCDALARYIQVQVMGLRTYMRANNNDVEQIDMLINNVFEQGLG